MLTAGVPAALDLSLPRGVRPQRRNSASAKPFLTSVLEQAREFEEVMMKDRKNSSRHQGDIGRQGQSQQSQQTSDRKHKENERSHQGESRTHRSQQR